MCIAIYPGSFDPITMGHLDVVTRASQIFEQIVMAVVKNPGKKPLIPVEDRVRLARESVRHLPNVQVEAFEGLTVKLAEKHQSKVIIRGLRAVSDFENEFAMAQINKKLLPGVDTVFLTAGAEYQFLSSSMMKEVALLGGDISGLVPEPVCRYFKTAFPGKVDVQ
ncbi:MAG TPA: pantetheine-phosphate adenylyltransferase [Oculatellaceae cyanobacterium]